MKVALEICLERKQPKSLHISILKENKRIIALNLKILVEKHFIYK